MQTILSFHELAKLLFKFIIKLLLPIFLEKEADQWCSYNLLIVLLTPDKEIQCFIFPYGPSLWGPSMDLAGKPVSKLLIILHHHFQRLT